MANVDDPKTWIPFMPSKDCSQGICSLYCPQWCNIIYPPPPFEFPDENSSPSFSPLVIAVIGILASAFLLASYYTIISKYCSSSYSTRGREHHDSNEELDDNHNPTLHETWHAATIGLDEALIKSITVCKYKKGEGLVEGTDCSVCLSEFQEDESIRLLPKCSHAFHLPCIDKWLKSHSSCPLCRANMVPFSGKPLSLPRTLIERPVIEIPSPRNETLPGFPQENGSVALEQDLEICIMEEEMMHGDTAPKNSLRAFSDLGNTEKTDSMIEIRDGGYQHLRRSLSIDLSCQTHSSVVSILCLNTDEVVQVEESQPGDASSSKQLSAGVLEKSSNTSRVLHLVMSPIAMKRSFSRRHTINIPV